MLRISVLVVLNLLKAPFWPFWALARWFGRPKSRWVHMRLSETLSEIDPPGPRWGILAQWIPALRERRPTSIRAVARLVDAMVEDPEREGLVVEVPGLSGAGWARIDALRAELVRLKRGGKKVAIYLPRGGGNRELFLASVADRVFATEGAPFFPVGIGATSRYLKGLLDKVGVHVEVYRRAAYKTAAETASESEMSEPQREQVGALLDTFDHALVDAMKERPGFDEDKVRALFSRGGVSGQPAIDLGIVDSFAFEDELPAKLGCEKMVEAGRYLRRHEARYFLRLFRRSYVAIVPVHGAIGDAAGRGASRASLVPTLRRVARDKYARAVVLHVDSPGGSALASDLIHREVQLLAEKKPVIACFGDVAASGGYYVAAPASMIVASRLSITGSIGVISARLVLGTLLDKLGIKTEVLRRAPHADLLTNPRAADEDERALMDREVDAFYRTFVNVVAKGRKREETEIEPLARGRVWSGHAALEKGLVDREGTLSDALQLAHEKIPGLPAGLKLRAVTITPHDGYEPPLDRNNALVALGATLDPDVAFLSRVLGGGERAMYYALGLPKID